MSEKKEVFLENLGIKIVPQSIVAIGKVCDERKVAMFHFKCWALGLTQESNLEGLFQDIEGYLVGDEKSLMMLQQDLRTLEV